MDEVIRVIQKVARNEAEKIYTTFLGEVTAIFPHEADGDNDNYQCSVRLKNKKQDDGSDFELRQVPVSTGHIGLVNIPNMGDMVLIAFIDGNVNAPVIIGRLYNDQQRPPVNEMGQIVLENTDSICIATKAGSIIEIDKEGNINIESAGKLSINKESQGEIEVFGDIVMNDGTNGAARLDDEVEVEIPAGTFIESVSGGGGAPALGMPNAAPVKVTGKIITSSETVKIGD